MVWMRLFLAFLVLVHASGASSDLGRQSLKARQLPTLPPLEALVTAKIHEKTLKKLKDHQRLSTREKEEIARAERATYIDLRRKGVDEVSNTPEATWLRNYLLRNKKRRGFIRTKQSSLAEVLFPGVSPEEYRDMEPLKIYADLVESKKTQVPFEYYDLPGCKKPLESPSKRMRRERRNLGSRLQGHDLQPAPYDLFVKQDKPCTTVCTVKLDAKELRRMRKLVELQYRVQLSLDSLPVLMRSKEHNYAVRGYPIGFVHLGVSRSKRDVYVYNHLKFTITYHENREQFDGIRITGFDVYPVSITHDSPSGPVSSLNIASCQGYNVENDPSKYLLLGFEQSPSVEITYSYDVRWVRNDLEWSDRWDVYLIGAPDDDIHYFSIVISLMYVLFMAFAIATNIIRTLRKDIAGYNELQTIEGEQDETGWKLVHGDVFRPPSFSPMLLSVLVGTGAQLGCSFVFALLLSMCKVTNPMKKGQVLASLILLYVLCGSVAGYMSARIYKFSEAKSWKMNSFLTATALPGVFVIMFTCLNVFLSFAGAATAVSFITILVLALLWVCVSAGLVFLGAFFGWKAPAIEVPTRTNQIARVIPENPGHMNPILTMLMGGILPFGSIWIELHFIMSALWLHEIYYVIGFLLPVLCILTATCVQVSIVSCYLQLCAEDHRWWWKSFRNCASAGLYLFAYSLWYLSSRLELVGVLPLAVYLTYMSMISICFSVFCGSIGFLSSLWLTRTMYSAVTLSDKAVQ